MTASEKNKQDLSDQEITYNILLNIRNTLNVMVQQQSKDDFLTYVRKIAPTLITDWHMGVTAGSGRKDQTVDGLSSTA
jgi:hypothetical protein